MTFSVSKYGVESSVDLGPVSVTPTVEDIVQEITVNSQENPLAAWKMLLP